MKDSDLKKSKDEGIKVYLVFYTEWDDYDDATCVILGAFSSKEAAEQVAGRYCSDDGCVKVQEFELDKELTDLSDIIYIM